MNAPPKVSIVISVYNGSNDGGATEKVALSYGGVAKNYPRLGV
jgi:hypothetical protein